MYFNKYNDNPTTLYVLSFLSMHDQLISRFIQEDLFPSFYT